MVSYVKNLYNGTDRKSFDFLLIEEVKKRPSIYDHTSSLYAHIENRKKMWEEICSAIVPGWNKLSDADKLCKGKFIRTRWSTCRDNFRRSFLGKLRRGKPCSDYYYADKLIFLAPIIEDKEKLINRTVPSQHDSSEEITNDICETSNAQSTSNSFDEVEDYTTNLGTINETTNPYESCSGSFIGITDLSESDDNWGDQMQSKGENDKSINSIKSRKRVKQKQSLNEEKERFQMMLLDAMQLEKEDDDRDFLLSLLPTLRKLDDISKFDVKAEFMQLLKNKLVNR